jgi:ABC-type multidrug transport system fused ATPase/permease subunit
MNMIRKLLDLLTPAERRRALLVLFSSLVMALLETAGVASIMPFLAVLGNPVLIQENMVLSALYEGFGFATEESFLLALGAGAFFLVVMGAAARIVARYAIIRFTEMRRHTIGARLLETYLRQPYAYFLNRHTSDLAKSILSEVDQVIENGFSAAFMIAAYALVVVTIIALLVIVDPLVAAVVGPAVIVIYASLLFAVAKSAGRGGQERAAANQERFTAAAEALGGIKDIKLLGREAAYLSRFRQPSALHARRRTTNFVLSELPRHVIEAAAFGGILALALFLLATREGLGEVLPLLGIYAFAGYKLLPAAQSIYGGLIRLRFGMAAITSLQADLEQGQCLAEIRRAPAEPMPVRQSIALRDVSFTYPKANRPALMGINIEIAVGTTVGIVGGTGAGKTTAVDLLLGLLEPSKGHLEVDGAVITHESLRQWQAALGYVPQSIFLADTSVTENIALGILPQRIDHEAVRRAARQAQLHEFITTEMPEGYATAVGERGVRLSGGQRQRIGIARALYHDPAVLVFDEATSALDNATEAAVLEAVQALHGHKTIIMIAHRLSTVASCDCIYVLKQGRLDASGEYRKLMQVNQELQRISRLNKMYL